MAKTFFIAGTDTDVGKTFVAGQLIKQLVSEGHHTLGYKPIAAGAVETREGLRNEDALTLQAASSGNVTYELINPICLAPPIAPHIAAAEAGTSLDLAGLQQWWQARPRTHEIEIVEGAGGWRLPLNGEETLADLVVAEQWPVILVVGMKLGCLNHAMLTVEAIERDGLILAGWVANQPGEPMDFYQQNLDYLREHIKAPLLAEIPPLANPITTDGNGIFNLSALIG